MVTLRPVIHPATDELGLTPQQWDFVSAVAPGLKENGLAPGSSPASLFLSITRAKIRKGLLPAAAQAPGNLDALFRVMALVELQRGVRVSESRGGARRRSVRPLSPTRPTAAEMGRREPAAL